LGWNAKSQKDGAKSKDKVSFTHRVSPHSKGLESKIFSSRLLKNLSESFDGAQDERRGFDIIEDFPFMLSKHSEPLFSNPLV
jgi:hypothetical protein